MAETRNERLLEITIYNLHLMCLVGYPAPKVKQLDDRMRAPRVGDLVLEVSTIYWEERVGTRLGRLERTVREPVFTPEEWAEGGGGTDPIPTEDIWYLTLADGREYRWHNATFIAVPTAIDRHDVEFVSDPAAFGIPPATTPTAAPPEKP
jgi:hypothetical protein